MYVSRMKDPPHEDPKASETTLEQLRLGRGLYRLSLAVIFAAVARLLMTLIVFYHSFPPRFQGCLDCIEG